MITREDLPFNELTSSSLKCYISVPIGGLLDDMASIRGTLALVIVSRFCSDHNGPGCGHDQEGTCP